MKEIFFVPIGQPIAYPKAILNVSLHFQRPGKDMKSLQALTLTILTHCFFGNMLATTLQNFLDDLLIAIPSLVARFDDDVSAFLGQLLGPSFSKLSEAFFGTSAPVICDPIRRSTQFFSDPLSINEICSLISCNSKSNAHDSIDYTLLFRISEFSSHLFVES